MELLQDSFHFVAEVSQFRKRLSLRLYERSRDCACRGLSKSLNRKDFLLRMSIEMCLSHLLFLLLLFFRCRDVEKCNTPHFSRWCLCFSKKKMFLKFWANYLHCCTSNKMSSINNMYPKLTRAASTNFFHFRFLRLASSNSLQPPFVYGEGRKNYSI